MLYELDLAAYKKLYGTDYFARNITENKWIINWGAVSSKLATFKGAGSKMRKSAFLRELNEWLEYCNVQDNG